MTLNKIEILILICLVIIIGVFAPIKLKDKYKNFMADPNWGLLEKSQVDDETIEEAIDRLIAVHNDDANAHIGAGKSLNTHKTQSTIDHPADSVIEDKVLKDNVTTDKLLATRFVIKSNFETIDAWDKTAGVSLISIAQAALETGAVINTERRLFVTTSDDNDGGGVPTDNPEFQTTIKVSDVTDQIAYICSGEPQDPWGWGFKIVDGTLYAWYTKDDGTEITQEIAGITLTDWIVLRAVFTGGTDIKFYVDGVLKHTATATLPTNQSSTFIMYSIENTAGNDKRLAIQDMIYKQDFFD